MLVGIDPGFSGAIALLDPVSRELMIFDMPVILMKQGRKRLDYLEVATLLTPTQEKTGNLAVLEQVSARPKEGVASAFRFGQGFGALEMAIHAHGYEVHYAAPTTWKKHFGLSSDKGLSRSIARERFPAQAGLFSRVKDDGRAEAALIALYAFEKLYRP